MTGNGMTTDQRHVKSLRSELHLELDSMGSGSTFKLSDSTHLQLQQNEAESSSNDVSNNDVSNNDVSKNDVSRLLRSLQSSFERHFKETLLCDVQDIIFR